MQAKLYFHSPFSDDTIGSLREKSLLLSFSLSEIFTCTKSESENWTLPFPSLKSREQDGPLNRLQEHTLLLLKAFPNHKTYLSKLQEDISHLTYLVLHNLEFSQKDFLKKMYLSLEPLVIECKNDMNFSFFLLTHQTEMANFLEPYYLPNLFKEVYPEGLSKLHTILCDYFHKKGFTRLLPEITILIQQLTKKEFIHESSTC